MSSASVKYIPKDAQVIMAILKELGINDFDPRVVSQLLEFVYWHTTIILDDARVFANHAKKKNVDVDDVKLAIQMHVEQMSSAGPPRDLLLEIARTKNSISLPPVKPQSSIRLPPDRYCLTQPNYRLKPNLNTVNRKKTSSFSNTSTSVQNNGEVSRQVQFTATSSPVLKQMPIIPPRISVSSPSFMAKSVLHGTNNGDILSSDSNTINRNSSTASSQSKIQTETEIDLMEMDSLNDHI